jgi:RNA polymerase sigma-70 factor (ECF subfamily)
VPEQDRLARFEQAVLPHLAAAYNLARWLTRNDHDAEDVVQESYLRAYRSFDRFRGTDGRPWLLAVVRNTCYTWLKQNRAHELATPFDETLHSPEAGPSEAERRLLQQASAELLSEALGELPAEFREVIVLRELEGLSYKDIAAVADVPLGTVMSRLTRARARLQQRLAPRLSKEFFR